MAQPMSAPTEKNRIPMKMPITQPMAAPAKMRPAPPA